MGVSIYLAISMFLKEFSTKSGNNVPWKQASWSVAPENGPDSKLFTENGP